MSTKWPGSDHDSRVFKMSILYENLCRRKPNGVIIGDFAYAAERLLLRPVNSPNAEMQLKICWYHCQNVDCRAAVQRALRSAPERIEKNFGVLRRPFHILRQVQVINLIHIHFFNMVKCCPPSKVLKLFLSAAFFAI